MQINRLNGFNVYSNRNYTNFKKLNKKSTQKTENPISGNSAEKNKKTALIAGGTALAGLGALAAALKNKRLPDALYKILRPYKNRFPKITINKDIDYNALAKEDFIRDFIEPVQKRAEGYILPNTGERYKHYPSNGAIVWGPDSKAKQDFFDWMVEQFHRTDAKIVDPKPGGIPKYDDIAKAWDKLFYADGMTPQKAAEQFEKDGKFTVFVAKNIDEMGLPSNYKGKKPPKRSPDDIFNDSPDTNDGAKKFGLIRIFSAKNTSKLDPGTLRTGRVEFKYLPMPYENEPLEIWKNYLECLRNSSGNTERIVNRLEKTKEIFQKRGEKDFKEIAPYLEYDLPYEGITFDAPLKKWKNWIEYMGSRKGINGGTKLTNFYLALNSIATSECTVSSSAQYQKITQNPKFQKISDMMKEQYLKFSDNPNKEKVWDLFVEKTMKGFTEHTT